MDPFAKCATFDRPKAVEAMGCYPYFITIESQAGPEVTVGGRSLLMFGSNNYLGLTQHLDVISAAVDAVRKYGTSCTGSRFLNGTLDLHVELERRLAEFTRKPGALVFTTGYQTNLGVISGIVGRHDLAVIDRVDHASVLDGCRLGWGEIVKYRHNDMDHLEQILEANAGKRGLVIVVDGIFSMEGDICDLPGIVRLKKKYGARLILDDAHGIGVLGASGRGTAEHFGLEQEVDLIIGTFSKSLASTGGFVAGDEEVIYYLKHHARSLIFSASTPPASAAAALASLNIIEREPDRRDRLWRAVDRWTRGLRELGLDTGQTESQIVPIVIGDDIKLSLFWRRLFDYGFYGNAAVTPAVEPGRALIRSSCIATHTDQHVDRALSIVAQAARELSLAPLQAV